MAGINMMARIGLMVFALGLLFALLGVGTAAWAQVVIAAAQEPGAVALPYDDVSAAGWALVASAVTLVVSLVVAVAKYLGIVMGAELRERLHSAVLSWARAAVARGLSRDEARALLPDYLEVSIADTMRKLQPVRSVLDALFDGKFEIAKAETLSGLVEIETLPARR